MKISRLWLFIVLFVVILFVAGFSFVYDRQFLSFTRADAPAEISLESSYIFVTPPSALANGVARERLTVFCLDSRGKGVVGIATRLIDTQGLVVLPVQDVTDSYGKSFYDISAKIPIRSTIGVICGDSQISAKALVIFQ